MENLNAMLEAATEYGVYGKSSIMGPYAVQHDVPAFSKGALRFLFSFATQKTPKPVTARKVNKV
ncbi:MAG: hypothetical protein JW896_03790 [Deltaproteobacteria bacterium]|nr:hypothetical protein [Deltaproteobacteria bacterium]